VATYKFALAAALLDVVQTGQQSISLSDLAIPYATHIVNHIKTQPKQGTANSSRFLDACMQYSENKIPLEQLHDITLRLGFVHVIDAFHILGNSEIPVRFFHDERENKRIILSDELLQFKHSTQFINLPHEVHARWQLVENAWKLGVNRSLVTVSYEANTQNFTFNAGNIRRTNLVSARPSLNGYQKGKCFYCQQDINVDGHHQNNSYAAVDHVLPFMLAKYNSVFADINGVWNLVLACQSCNSSKSDLIPDIQFIQKLHERNNYFVDSHHPLRETILYQTGHTPTIRVAFLQDRYTKAKEIYPTEWRPR
jgi:5-methylcytosine-specific restriction endonuclease McrA